MVTDNGAGAEGGKGHLQHIKGQQEERNPLIDHYNEIILIRIRTLCHAAMSHLEGDLTYCP